MSVKLKNAAVILAACETKSGGATEGERALASLCASLEARIVEVKWERDAIARNMQGEIDKLFDRAERAEAEREDALDKASVEEAVGKVLGGQLNDAEKRLAEVVKAIRWLSKCAKKFQLETDEKKRDGRIWDALYEAIERADAALAPAREEAEKGNEHD